MMTYRSGAAGAKYIASLMSRHLMIETDVPEIQGKRQPDDTLRLTGDSGETGATE